VPLERTRNRFGAVTEDQLAFQFVPMAGISPPCGPIAQSVRALP
jgi:hypothetical protein